MLDPSQMLPPSSARAHPPAWPSLGLRARYRTLRQLVLCLSLAAWVVSPAAGHAQGTELASASAGYDDLIKRAIVEFDNSHWAEARALFRRAHELSPNARTFRGLGITAFELRRYVEATAELQASLTDTNKPLTSKQREEVQGLLSRAHEFVAIFTLALKPANATLVVDGVSQELADGRLRVDPGPHHVLARAEGYHQRELELKADAGQRVGLQITLLPLQTSKPEPVAVRAAPISEPAPVVEAASGRRVWTWVLAGAAVGSGVTGVALRMIARGENDDFKSCTGDNCERLREDGQRHELIATVMFGVAGGLAVTSIAAYFLEGRSLREQQTAGNSRSRASTQLRLHPFGAALTHHF